MLALVFPLVAAAGEGHHKGKGHFEKLTKELNLSQDQMKKVKEIKAKFEPSLKEGKAAAMSAKGDLITSLQAPKRGPEYKAELLEKFKKVQALKAAQHQKHFEMALEIRELLTDEQITKFKAMHERRFHGKHGPGHDDEE